MASRRGRRRIRPLVWLGLAVFAIIAFDLAVGLVLRQQHHARARQTRLAAQVTAALGLSDLCLATEARYTRHPALTDMAVPFMDHPGAVEHFPSGSFWAPARPYRSPVPAAAGPGPAREPGQERGS